MERREEQLRNNTNGVRRNNWPPLPEKCCFQPCFYQDINVEIPSEFQKIVRQLYYLWMCKNYILYYYEIEVNYTVFFFVVYAMIMCANVFGGLLIMFHSSEYEAFMLSILYAFLFTPASFLCWYVLYNTKLFFFFYNLIC